LARAEAPPFRALTGHFCLLGRAALAFAQNDLETASDLAERFLRAIPPKNCMERLAGLELFIMIQVVAGALAQAEATLAELCTAATSVATKPVQASARFAAGVVAAATENHDAAKNCFEDAIDLWTRYGPPYETALARLELARSLLALGRSQRAEQQARKALDVLHQLGAVPDAARADALIDEIAATAHGHGEPTPAVSDLTAREAEVLRLISTGKSNQDIARELVLSIRTVERHISNIYTKIGASGPTARATATAYALHHGLT
jgi:ATP/maltotriose-dependent transcriptional regulator MalT